MTNKSESHVKVIGEVGSKVRDSSASETTSGFSWNVQRGRPPNQLRLSYITTRSPGSIMTERRLLLVEPDTEDCSTERLATTECRPGAGCGLGSTGNARLLHCKCGAAWLRTSVLASTSTVHNASCARHGLGHGRQVEDLSLSPSRPHNHLGQLWVTGHYRILSNLLSRRLLDSDTAIPCWRYCHQLVLGAARSGHTLTTTLQGYQT